jgi:hypothetical protein
MYNFPKQRLPYSRKAASNFKWAKDVVDSILSYSPQDEGVVNKYNLLTRGNYQITSFTTINLINLILKGSVIL